jgi:mono/diheme cytochrome c family protein
MLELDVKILAFARFAALTVAASVLPASAQPPDAGSADFFERQVRPILADHCHACHGPETQKSGLRLDSAAAMVAGGSRGQAVVAGDVSSLLLQVIEYVHEPQMPPKGKLPQAAIDTLTAWVLAGAVWPEYPEAVAATATSDVDGETGRHHWAYRKPVRPTVPEVRDSTWPRGDIDRFLLAAMDAEGLHPAPQADKRTLIRRVTYDLTGLPPTPEDVDAFLADEYPDAFVKVVDRLLASPQYGERWGRHWLDVVRYTDSFDSRGTPATEPDEIWRYRDWVVNALNADMPYDQFLMRQIAGDIMPGADGAFSGDNLVATGVLAIGHWPQGDADKEKMVADIVDDQVDLVSRGFLATTLACARCHDHKFDPFSTEDYYAMAGVFFSSSILPGPGQKTEGSPILHLPIASKEELTARSARDARMTALREQIAATIQNDRTEWAKQESRRIAQYMLAAHAMESTAPGADISSLTTEDETPVSPFEGGMIASPPTQEHVSGDVAEPPLNTEAVARWARFLGYGPGPLLPKFERDMLGTLGLHARRGATDMPSAVANTTGAELKYLSITQPARSLVVHPSPTEPARIAWRSPVAGTVTITGRLADADGTCGNGVRWTIERRTQRDSAILADGVLAHGQAVDIAIETPIEVAPRDSLVLSVLPENDYSCDSTVVELHVRAIDRVAWDLVADVLPRFTGSGPWPDVAGNPNVWWLLDSGSATMPDPLVFAPWWTALEEVETGRLGDEALATAAGLVQQALLNAETLTEGPLAMAYAAVIGENGPFWIESPPLPDSAPRLALEAELRALESESPSPLEYATGIQEGGVPNTAYAGTQDVRVHRRGDYNNLGDLVPRRMPVVLAGESHTPITEGSGRLQLAAWVASKENPLTARVMVNRTWQHYFGEGIVRTPGDFGRQGEAPTHPELLDWLACEFMESGWSMKSMHRAIAMSAAYQQASDVPTDAIARDPENRFLTRANRKRLEAEALRDSLLAASGRLDLTPGGPAFADLATPRRTLYLRTVRSDRSTYTMLFDGADPTSIVPKRTESLVSPQALFLMNHPFVLDEAQALIQGMPNDVEATVNELYRRLFSRTPTEHEMALAKKTLNQLGYPGNDALTAYAQVLLGTNEFLFVD